MTAPVAGDGSVVGPGDARQQVRTILQNISDILSDHGGGLADVVHLTAFVVDPADTKAVAETVSEAFGAEPPAISLVGGVTLPSPAFAVEIAAIAQVGS
jgi:enamine deaminase RidA (YjgF/YER057c/UK114 family)